MVDYCRILLVAAVALVAAACQPGGELETRALTAGHGEPQNAAAPAAENSQPDAVATATAEAPAVGAVAATERARHFIEFRARRGYTYGHSLVLFGRLDAAGEIVDVEVAGLTPGPEGDAASFVAGHLVPVNAGTGYMAGDLDEDAVLTSWRIALSEDEYRDVASFIGGLQARAPTWHATFYNCNAFVADIARHMGYRTPMTLMPPLQFVQALRAMNGARDRAATMAYAPQPSEPSTLAAGSP